MRTALARILNDGSEELRGKVIAMYALLAAFNVALWGLTFVVAAFLYIIGIINLLVLMDIYRMFRRVTNGGAYNEETLEQFLAQRGMMNRFFGPLVRAIDKSWKMYPLGLLFGLGFDTASE